MATPIQPATTRRIDTENGEVVLRLTAQQVRILGYVVERAGEDPDFFGAGHGGDRKWTIPYHNAIAQLRDLLQSTSESP